VLNHIVEVHESEIVASAVDSGAASCVVQLQCALDVVRILQLLTEF
jgi:hypothetical protein